MKPNDVVPFACDGNQRNAAEFWMCTPHLWRRFRMISVNGLGLNLWSLPSRHKWSRDHATKTDAVKRKHIILFIDDCFQYMYEVQTFIRAIFLFYQLYWWSHKFWQVFIAICITKLDFQTFHTRFTATGSIGYMIHSYAYLLFEESDTIVV